MEKIIQIPEGYDAKIEGDKIIFVEKESEDERIRKEIILILGKHVSNQVSRLDINECITWLEKQKEPTPVKFDDDIEVGLDRALQIVKAAKGNLCGYQSDDGIYECCHAIQILESILKNGIEQKSVEWSEEDIDAFVKSYSDSLPICGEFQSYHDALVHAYRQGVVNTLNSARPQPQRRDTYYDIIHSILAMLKDMDFSQITPQHRVSLLNDIRVKCKDADECATILDEHHWKPREDHFQGLRRGIMKMTKGSDAWNSLTDLYEQLQKL